MQYSEAIYSNNDGTEAQVSSQSLQPRFASFSKQPKGIISRESTRGCNSSSQPKPYCKNDILSDPQLGHVLLSLSFGSKYFGLILLDIYLNHLNYKITTTRLIIVFIWSICTKLFN